MYTAALQFLSKADEKLATILSQLPLPDHESTKDVFFDLVSCVIEQQIHYRSSKKIFEKRLKMAELDWLTPENFSIFEEKGLKDLKISLQKQETLLAVVDFFSQNNLQWHQLDDETIAKTLGSIKGIGQWTIDMILLYTLERPNVFPVDDFRLKQAMISLYGLDPKIKLKANMLAIAKNWEGYKSLAVRYLLAWKATYKMK